MAGQSEPEKCIVYSRAKNRTVESEVNWQSSACAETLKYSQLFATKFTHKIEENLRALTFCAHRLGLRVLRSRRTGILTE